MAPRSLAYVLGLCNLVAGALLMSRPRLLLGDLAGTRTPAAELLLGCLGLVLIAVGSGAMRMPSNALPTYLWIFGVAVKVVAALLWSLTALETGTGALWMGAGGDAAIALVIAVGLLRAVPEPDGGR